jgi:arylamine N-acetyltransferase
MRDFDAYVERIGLAADSSPSLRDIHREHVTPIPFENLDGFAPLTAPDPRG